MYLDFVQQTNQSIETHNSFLADSSHGIPRKSVTIIPNFKSFGWVIRELWVMFWSKFELSCVDFFIQQNPIVHLGFDRAFDPNSGFKS
jgi:hypothetical protein